MCENKKTVDWKELKEKVKCHLIKHKELYLMGTAAFIGARLGSKSK
jgi:hypothetical protein